MLAHVGPAFVRQAAAFWLHVARRAEYRTIIFLFWALGQKWVSRVQHPKVCTTISLVERQKQTRTHSLSVQSHCVRVSGCSSISSQYIHFSSIQLLMIQLHQINTKVLRVLLPNLLSCTLNRCKWSWVWNCVNWPL